MEMNELGGASQSTRLNDFKRFDWKCRGLFCFSFFMALIDIHMKFRTSEPIDYSFAAMY